MLPFKFMWRGAALLAAALATGCGDDDPVRTGNRVVPQSWEGVWAIRWEQTDCGAGSPTVTNSEETFCAGSDVASLFPTILELCPNAAVDITATTLTFSCDESGQAPGCTYRTRIDLNGTVDESAGTLVGTGRFEYTADPQTGDCGTNECFTVAIQGTRLATDPPACLPDR